MARKAREASAPTADTWATPYYWIASAGYDVPKTSNIFGSSAITNACVVLHLPEDDSPSHALLSLAASAQELILLRPDADAPPALVTMDLTPLMVESINLNTNMQAMSGSRSTTSAATAALDSEGASASTLGKQLGKPASRALCKLLGSGMRDVTLLACHGAAQLLFKLIGASSDERALRAVKRIVLVHPRLTAQCVNAQLGRGAAQRYAHLGNIPLDVIFESQAASERRLPALRHLFPDGKDRIATGDYAAMLVYALRSSALAYGGAPSSGTGGLKLPALPSYDAESMDCGGRTLWLSELGFAISRETKQHEARIIDASQVYAEARTAAIVAAANSAAVSATSAAFTFAATVGGSADRASDGVATSSATALPPPVVVPAQGGANGGATHEVGLLVLRGCRCVLARSLSNPPLWRGMRIPSVALREGETHHAAAKRAASEFCDIEQYVDSELLPLPSIPPVCMYRPDGVQVLVYAYYAARPPPEGPLEDADEEDDEDLYDWYTWPRALEALKADAPSLATLRTMACALSAAVAAGELPVKWGGVFGQEWTGQEWTGQGALGANTDASPSVSMPPPPPSAAPSVVATGGTQPTREQLLKMLVEMPLADVIECSAAAAAAVASRFQTERGSVDSTRGGTGNATPPALDELKFCAIKPLHPARLYDALESAKDGGGVRVDGLAWLVTQPGLQALVRSNGQTGAIEVEPGEPWWASVPREKWPQGLAEEIAPMWHDPHGDRQVDLTLSEGTEAARQRLHARLTACLLTDEEATLNPDSLDDPYADDWKSVLDVEAEEQRANIIADAMKKAKLRPTLPSIAGQVICVPCTK